MSHILVGGVKGNLHALPEDLNILLTFKTQCINGLFTCDFNIHVMKTTFL